MKLHDRILKILENKPATRNSDTELMLATWESFGLYLTKEQAELLKSLPKLESITRARRTIQNDMDLYKASERVQKARMDKTSTIRQNIARTPVDERGELVDNNVCYVEEVQIQDRLIDVFDTRR